MELADIFWTQITFHMRYHVPEQLIFSFQIMFGQNIHLAGISNQENVPEQALNESATRQITAVSVVL